MYYRKRPVTIEAKQWDPRNPREVLDWLSDGGCSYLYLNNHLDPDRRLQISTLEGTMQVKAGVYVIKGIRQEFYPCNALIFEETYEPVEEVSEYIPPPVTRKLTLLAGQPSKRGGDDDAA